jgi:DNA-binding beta-propeller fold protein YncE
VTRIDPSTGAVATFTIPGVEGAGIAFARGSVWLLSSVPRGAVVRLDPQTLAVQARIDLHPVGRLHPFKEAWGLVGDDDRLWVADPNYNTVTEIDPATEAVKRQVHRSPATPMDEPFGIALAGDDVWVAGRNGVTRIDERTGEVVGELGLPQDQYTNVVVGFGAAWVTRFLPATLVKVTPPWRSQGAPIVPRDGAAVASGSATSSVKTSRSRLQPSWAAYGFLFRVSAQIGWARDPPVIASPV